MGRAGGVLCLTQPTAPAPANICSQQGQLVFGQGSGHLGPAKLTHRIKHPRGKIQKETKVRDGMRTYHLHVTRVVEEEREMEWE